MKFVLWIKRLVLSFNRTKQGNENISIQTDHCVLLHKMMTCMISMPPYLLLFMLEC